MHLLKIKIKGQSCPQKEVNQGCNFSKGLKVHKVLILKKYITEKVNFQWPYVTFNNLWGHTSYYKKNCLFIILAFVEMHIKKSS